MPHWLRELWQFLTAQKEPLDTLLEILGFLLGSGALGRGLYRLYLRRRRARLPTKPHPFDVITDPNRLLPRLYAEEDNPDPLADHRIPYRRRLPDRDLQAELRQKLNARRYYLLITGPTGCGKTREAATLALSLMAEGYRVVRVLKSPWLEVPKAFPAELGEDSRRILLLLDDLDGLFRLGPRTLPPGAEEGPVPGVPSVHDRLLHVLDYFEGVCGEGEVRVLATARSEESKWQVLDFDPRDRLWGRFERVELDPPSDEAVIGVLGEGVERAGLDAEREQFPAIARTNDQTFANVVINLRRLRSEGKPVTQAHYTPTLHGSWQEVYGQAAGKHPAVAWIYDAIAVLQQARVELFLWMVESAALLLGDGPPLQRLRRRRAVRRGLRYLVNERILPLAHTRHGPILAPRDGQIEGKGDLPGWRRFARPLLRLVLRLADRHPEAIMDSLIGFSAVLYEMGRFEQATALMRKAIERDPNLAQAYSNLGTLLSRLERPAEAEAAYRQAIERDPHDATAYNNLGTLLSRLERPAEAEAAYRQAIERDPHDATAYNNLGTLLSRLERPAEAEAAYRQAIERDPNYATAYYNLGTLLAKLERPAEAEAAYRQAIERDPNDATAYYNLGTLLAKLERPAEAEAAYRQAIERDPNDATAYYNLGLLLHEKLERPAEAEAAYRQAIERDPNYATAYYNLGLLLHEKLERPAEAEAAYRQAIERDPNDATAYSNLGNLLAKLERPAEAEAAYRQAIERDPNYATAYSNLGLLLHEKLERPAEAEAAYRQAIERDPNYATAYSNLGLLLHEKLERPAEAEAAYRQAIERDPNYATAYSNLGLLLHEKLERPAEAEAAYRQAIERDPNYATAYSNLGLLLHEKLERPAEAEAAYRQAIERDPNYATAYNNLGLLLHEKLERPAEAEAAYRQAIERDPNYATAYSNLGLLLHEKLERPAEAEAAYRQAIERDPNYATAYNNLGTLLSRLERPAEAEAAYRQAIERDPNYATAYSNLGNLLRLGHRLAEALPLFQKSYTLKPRLAPLLNLAGIYRQLGDAAATAKYAAETRSLIPADDWYNLACLESICGNTDAALEHLRRAVRAEDFDPAWAWQDPDLEWIRDDPRFAEIVPTTPSRTSSGEGPTPFEGGEVEEG